MNTSEIEPSAWPCRRCGNCCRVPGYVRLTAQDVDRLAVHLNLTPADFTNRYTRLTRDRRGLSLDEQQDGACVFLDAQGRCSVNAAKPRQCREFPLNWNFDGYEDICAAAHRHA